jgi:hypothetical protein
MILFDDGLPEIDTSENKILLDVPHSDGTINRTADDDIVELKTLNIKLESEIITNDHLTSSEKQKTAEIKSSEVKQTSMDGFDLEILKFINEISNSKYQYFRLNDTILKTNRNMDMDLGILHDKAANEINNAYFEANINQIKEEIKLVQNHYPLNEPEPDD